MKQLISHFVEKQKTLFLVDSVGAFMTAFFLFVVMRQYDEYFGMPERELIYLSAIAASYCIYSAACYLFVQRAIVHFMAFIGFANIIYSVVTIILMIRYYPILTKIGVLYFMTEIVVIWALSYLELRVATESREEKKTR